MDETYLDEEPAVNFERATLEIKDPEGTEFSNSAYATNGYSSAKNTDRTAEPITTSKDVSNIPFKHVDVHSFFSDRNEVVERAINDCHTILTLDSDKEVIGSWLLTEISLWDTEKERLILLTKKALYTIKYDFISLKILEHNRVPLSDFDTVVAGEIMYPSSSLVPRLSGIAEGVSSVIHSTVRQGWSTHTTCSNLSQFEPRKRYLSGMRLMWNKGQPLPLAKKWNPFAKNIPWLTYASHPLFWHKGSEADKARYDVEGLHSAILSYLSEDCNVISGSIIVENYFGIGALVHNKNDLGFFKIRGKISF